MLPNAIVLMIDRLSAGFLGPYGNTWVETPMFNRLAAESLLADFAFTDTADLARVYRSFWQGSHALADSSDGLILPQILRDQGVHTVLLTDDPQVAEAESTQPFTDRIQLSDSPCTGAAEDPSQTRLAQLVATAIVRLEDLPEPYCLWIHARGMNGLWDAPWECRNQYADEEDPAPPTFLAPPVERWEGDVDPDFLLGLQQAYAGQVTLVDTCLGVFLEALEHSPAADRTLLAVSSPRGYPLGEHGDVGDAGPWLFNEHIQVPCLLRFPDRALRTRDRHSVQPPDLYATLRAWFGSTTGGPLPWGRDLAVLDPSPAALRPDIACSILGDAWTLRTPAWSLHAAGDSPLRLFAKPDDRWEVNEVAELCPDVVDLLQDVRRQFAAAVAANDPSRLPSMPELLTERLH